MSESTTLDLRIGATFAVLGAGFAGGIVSYTFSTWPASLIKLFSAGVIASLAFVHIIPEAIELLTSISEYPLGGVCVLVGTLTMIVVEQVCHEHSTTDIGNADHEHGHQHLCASPHKPADNVLAAKHTVMVYCMELGCIFHSIIIGTSLGVTVEGRSDVFILLIALAFHQLIEGFVLWHMLWYSTGKMSNIKKAACFAAYSLTKPLGIATGIIIANHYNPETQVAYAVQGIMNGIAGGMLIYIALIQLVAEELSQVRPSKWHLYGALVAGATPMCVLATWA